MMGMDERLLIHRTRRRRFLGAGLIAGGSGVLRCLPIPAAVAAVLCLGPAVAQEPERGATVTERSRPELDPLGLRLGSFLVYPRLAVGERFDDNIFAVDDNWDADFITTVTPDARIQSD